MRPHVFVATVFHDVMSVADDVEAVSEAPVESELATQPKDGAIEDLIAAMEAPPAECVDDMSVSSGDEIVVTDHKPLKGAHLLTSRLFPFSRMFVAHRSSLASVARTRFVVCVAEGAVISDGEGPESPPPSPVETSQPRAGAYRHPPLLLLTITQTPLYLLAI